MEFSAQQIMEWVAQFIWPLFRIGGLLMVAPVLSHQSVPNVVRILLGVAICIVIMPIIPATPSFDGPIVKHILTVVHEIMVGVAMGFVMKVVFEVFVLGGQIIAMQSGLGFANLVDPNNGSIPVLGMVYLLLVSLLFLIGNGHLMLIELLVESFTTIPITEASLSPEIFWQFAHFGTWLFSGALMIALPAVIALLLLNLGFGIMTRAAPQLNIFAIGFPISLTVGLFLVMLLIPSMMGHVEVFFERGIRIAANMIHSGGTTV